jgi:tetratricopeptide (TPR) repeat protein
MTCRLLCCWLLGAALCACASAPPAVVAPAPAPAVEPVVAAEAPAPVPDAVPDLLAFQAGLRALKPAALNKALQDIGPHPSTARQQVRRAMLLAALRGSGDLQRAQTQLEMLVALQASDRDTLELKPLAQMLAALYADARRQDENIDKLNQQLRDSQRRYEQQGEKIEQLGEKLEALKNIERSLSVRPASTPPMPPPK